MVVVAILLQTICAPLFIKRHHMGTRFHIVKRDGTINKKGDSILYFVLSVLVGAFAIYMDFHIWLHPQEITEFCFIFMLSVDVMLALKILCKKIILIYGIVWILSYMYSAITVVLWLTTPIIYQLDLSLIYYVYISVLGLEIFTIS